MATSPQPLPDQMSAAPPGPQGAPAPPSAKPTQAVVQIVGGIEELTAMLQAVFPPAAPDVQDIKKSIQNIQVLMAQTQNPQQSPAPPI